MVPPWPRMPPWHGMRVTMAESLATLDPWRTEVRRVPDLEDPGQALAACGAGGAARHERWVCESLEDMPEVWDWTWTAACGAAT